METVPTWLPDDAAITRPATQTRHPQVVPPLRGLKYQRVVIGGKQAGLTLSTTGEVEGRGIETRPPVAITEMGRFARPLGIDIALNVISLVAPFSPKEVFRTLRRISPLPIADAECGLRGRPFSPLLRPEAAKARLLEAAHISEAPPYMQPVLTTLLAARLSS